MTVKIGILGFGINVPAIRDILSQAGHLEGADVVLWELTGQSRFSILWAKTIAASHVVIVAVDGALENVLRSKKIVSMVREEVPYALLASIVIMDKKDPRDEKAFRKILDTPVHLLNFTDSDFDTRIIEFVRKLIQEGSKITIPEPEKKPTIDKHLLLEFLRANLRKKMLTEGGIEELIQDLEQDSESTLLKIRDILSGPEIHDNLVEWILLKCQEIFQGGTS